MATKTFKIGLSNTDKQNMAQDVYERLIAMCFDEYDSSKTYNEGDFVVYENPENTFKLYKCNSDNVTGAWDSTKWDLATFQDLVDDIESAVAFVNDKANVDGNYPTMTVGVADQLSPYDEESGDDQDEPFSFQATGTGNGSQPDFSTGSIALMKEKQGNTVVVNQYAQDLDNSDWDFYGVNGSVENGVVTITEKTNTYTSNGYQILNSNIKENRVYLAIINAKKNDNDNPCKIAIGFVYNREFLNLTNTYSTYFKLLNITTFTQDNKTLCVGYANPNIGDEQTGFSFNLFKVIDLTQWFDGDIPQDLVDNPENFFRYYQGSLAYNTGELVNANGRYIKCIGMNQWDEEYLSGYTLTSEGNLADGVIAICSKNYIQVIPNRDYYYKVGTGGYLVICFYDKDKNFIERLYGVARNDKYKTPSDAIYMKFSVVSGYGTTYNNDISINLYYEDESRCLTYEPYEVLANNDTGTEILRSAGSVKDIKKPDGIITRRVGVIDLGTLTYTTTASGLFASEGLSLLAKKPSSSLIIANISSAMYIATDSENITGPNGTNPSPDKVIAFSPGGALYINNLSYNDAAAFKTAMSGVYLFYELAEPTTEQGTTFSPNLIIDDFGSMEFQGTNGVPQGNLIFYPVDYKAFIDTLYNYADGTPSKLALKSDLPTASQTWAESLPGYDATKTQTLKNVNGVLTWVDDE